MYFDKSARFLMRRLNWFYFLIFISELFLSHDDMEKLHDFEEECAEDYFREKDIQLQSSSDKRIQVINERFVLWQED